MTTRRLKTVEPDPPPTTGSPKPDPKMRLVEVAARHFAEAGFEGASQRAIQREVGVNPATAHYYFGSKEALYRAVLERYLGRIQAERIAALPKANATPGASARFHALLVAYLTPHIHTAATEGGYNYARILAAIQFTSPGPATTIINEAVNPVREMYVDALKALFPQAPRSRIYNALHMTVMLMAMAPIRAREQLKDPKGRRALIDELVAFSEAGFRAMCGEPTLAE
jgi:TetR/AcrR family transcriptional regulator, regulator of cefoperazone and chloramphenicol sensitivity